ncbi:hypothetical protein PR001_g20212 [Phytophthora rubi]|uniref:Uncharacterized protein n=1 Tax=Phytophthora rubi TaxID=129364 RepID=A0A6A3JIY2_9STRA|nr:hypothetical protein PR002_g20763 [Phytophthora rubi]KAE8995076.1 hypothetical protein PR001_g20212 [Phytophthora rubi]
MQLDSAASPAPLSPGLRLQIPNPFDPADGSEADEVMPTASPWPMDNVWLQRRRSPNPRTQWGGAFAMPVGACIESKTKRMVTRYEFNLAPHLVGEEQWIEYFKQANAPSHVD